MPSGGASGKGKSRRLGTSTSPHGTNYSGGDDILQRLLDANEESREKRREKVRRRKQVTLPRLRFMEGSNDGDG